jgi:hypothetical protein
VVNLADRILPVSLELEGFRRSSRDVAVEELCARLEAVNTAAAPNSVKPLASTWRWDTAAGPPRRILPPHSFTVMRFE